MGGLSGAGRRRKGHDFERELVRLLRPVFGDIERVKAGDRLDLQGVDLRGTGRLRFQAKRNRAYCSIRKIEEVRAEGIPVLVTKGDKLRAVACLYLDDLIEILQDIGVVYEQ